jgi:hypothetical protein
MDKQAALLSRFCFSTAVSEAIKLLITIVGQISKFEFRYATGV